MMFWLAKQDTRSFLSPLFSRQISRKKQGKTEKMRQNNNADKEAKWVVDSIRNPGEIRLFREFSRNFFLMAVCADRHIRWERVRPRYNGNLKNFEDDDKNDTGEDNPPHGQRVGDCFSEADIIISNNEPIAAPGTEDFDKLAGRVKRYADLVAEPLTRVPIISRDEALMAAAYAVSLESSCLKRKVGAVVVDANQNIISS